MRSLDLIDQRYWATDVTWSPANVLVAVWQMDCGPMPC